MKVCPDCHVHNHQHAHECHECSYSFAKPASTITLKSMVLLGVLGSSCIVAESKYGVPMVDNDEDGVYGYEDCDDNDPQVGMGVEYHFDNDGDGFGESAPMGWVCPEEEIPEGWIEDGTDCNDEDANIHPEAEETAGDGVDSNCNDDDDT